MAINLENIAKLQQIKFDLFKSQNPEIGRFDVTFDVGGKLLYAHKTNLNLVSDTFDSMLSDRWNLNKDEPIRIKDYAYDDFYQFLIFLYSGQCQLNEINICSMVDIAEFYGVDLFKKYCERYLFSMKIIVQNVFPMMELAEKYSMIQLKAATLAFITTNFQVFINCDEIKKLSKHAMGELVHEVKDKVKPDDLFQVVYNWSEKEAIDKHAADPNINLNDSIKAGIAPFLPLINFCRMEIKFLHDFVISHGFVFSSYKELSKIICDRDNYGETKIKITNERGQTLHGNLIRDKTAIENIEHLKSACGNGSNMACWWSIKTKNIPTTPSPIKKRDGIEWYLVYSAYNAIGVKRSSYVFHDEYVLAELNAGASGFDTAVGCKIEIIE